MADILVAEREPAGSPAYDLSAEASRQLGYSALRLVALSTLMEIGGEAPVRELSDSLAAKGVINTRIPSYLEELAEDDFVRVDDEGIRIDQLATDYVAGHAERLNEAELLITHVARFAPSRYKLLGLLEREAGENVWFMGADSQELAAEKLSVMLDVKTPSVMSNLTPCAAYGMVDIVTGQHRSILNVKLSSFGQAWLDTVREVFPERALAIDDGAEESGYDGDKLLIAQAMGLELNHMELLLYGLRRDLSGEEESEESQEAVRQAIIPAETFDVLSEDELKRHVRDMTVRMKRLGNRIDSTRWQLLQRRRQAAEAQAAQVQAA